MEFANYDQEFIDSHPQLLEDAQGDAELLSLLIEREDIFDMGATGASQVDEQELQAYMRRINAAIAIRKQKLSHADEDDKRA
jgi:hypothetical protein